MGTATHRSLALRHSRHHRMLALRRTCHQDRIRASRRPRRNVRSASRRPHPSPRPTVFLNLRHLASAAVETYPATSRTKQVALVTRQLSAVTAPAFRRVEASVFSFVTPSGGPQSGVEGHRLGFSSRGATTHLTREHVRIARAPGPTPRTVPLPGETCPPISSGLRPWRPKSDIIHDTS